LSRQRSVAAEDLKPGYGSQAPHAHRHTATSAGFGQDCQLQGPVQGPLELGQNIRFRLLCGAGDTMDWTNTGFKVSVFLVIDMSKD